MKEFLDGLSGLTSWRAWVAAGAALIGWLVETLIGDLYGPQARGVELVVFMFSADFVAGTWAAILTKTWTWDRLRGACGKLFLWALLLAVSVRIVRYTTDNWSMDAVFGYVSNFLIAYLVLVDLLSILGHAVVLSHLSGVKMPLLGRLIRLMEEWQDRGILPNKLPEASDVPKDEPGVHAD